jgi:hypothetical protein
MTWFLPTLPLFSPNLEKLREYGKTGRGCTWKTGNNPRLPQIFPRILPGHVDEKKLV